MEPAAGASPQPLLPGSRTPCDSGTTTSALEGWRLKNHHTCCSRREVPVYAWSYGTLKVQCGDSVRVVMVTGGPNYTSNFHLLIDQLLSAQHRRANVSDRRSVRL